VDCLAPLDEEEEEEHDQQQQQSQIHNGREQSNVNRSSSKRVNVAEMLSSSSKSHKYRSHVNGADNGNEQDETDHGAEESKSLFTSDALSSVTSNRKIDTCDLIAVASTYDTFQPVPPYQVDRKTSSSSKQHAAKVIRHNRSASATLMVMQIGFNRSGFPSQGLPPILNSAPSTPCVPNISPSSAMFNVNNTTVNPTSPSNASAGSLSRTAPEIIIPLITTNNDSDTNHEIQSSTTVPIHVYDSSVLHAPKLPSPSSRDRSPVKARAFFPTRIHVVIMLLMLQVQVQVQV
jgi:hypothetical protein